MLPEFTSDAVTATSTTALYKLGYKVVTKDATYGTKFWRYVLNSEAATAFAAGTIVQRKASTVSSGTGIVCVTAKTPRFKVLGVAQNAIAAGSYGFILCEGVGSVLGDGSVTANSSVESEGTTGRAKNATLTNADEVAAVIGIALGDDGAADSTFTAYVSVP
jgi:hypothetical protein